MRLATDDGRIGFVGLTAEGADRYEVEHARLLRLLEDPFTIALANTLDHHEVQQLRDRLADDNRYLQRELLRISGDEIVGTDFGLREVLQKVQQVAPTESAVLLTGETGVGKGVGHEKGAFTGALSRKRGRFERANKGTILLDEIGEMPLQAQVRLLRVIQYREIERVGGTERIPVDIRIIAATNRDLAAMVQAGRFREDLWFRLNVFPIAVPPLRERGGDIPALVQHFIERKAGELKIGETPRLASGAIDELMAYDWPGNVRELENLVERAMILHRGEPLRFDDLGTSLPGRVAAHSPAPEEETLALDAVIARHIKRVLSMTDGKIHGPEGAGELLGVNSNTLRSRMRKLGIPFRKQLGPR
jgi:transcriptional regulator with GAF, ATPase, and Fis domain